MSGRALFASAKFFDCAQDDPAPNCGADLSCAGQAGQSDVFYCGGGLPGGDAERSGLFDFYADAEVFAGGFEVNILLVIEPALNPAGRDADADVIPSVVIKICFSGGFIIGGIVVIDA